MIQKLTYLIALLLLLSCGGDEDNNELGLYNIDYGAIVIQEKKLFETKANNEGLTELDWLSNNGVALDEFIDNAFEPFIEDLPTSFELTPQKEMISTFNAGQRALQDYTINDQNQIIINPDYPNTYTFEEDKIVMCTSISYFGFGPNFNTCLASDAQSRAENIYASGNFEANDTILTAVITFDYVRE